MKEEENTRSKRSPELTWELPAPIPASRPELLLQGQKSRDSKARETPGAHRSLSCRGLSCSRGCSGADGRERLWASTGHVRGLQEWEKLPGNGTEPSRGWESPGGLLWRTEMAERTIPTHRGVLGTASPGNTSQWHLQGDSIPVNPLDGMDGIHSKLTKK